MASWEQQVRQWAWDNGVECSSRGRVPKRVLREYLEAHPDEAEIILNGEADAWAPSNDVASAPEGEAEVTAPLIEKPSPRERFRSWAAPKPKTAKPRGKRGPRASTAGILSVGWELFAETVARIAPGPGLIMAWEAPVAGAILDEAVAGLPPDKLLQPLARNSGKGKAVGALIGPPLLVFAMQQDPGRIPLLMPRLRSALFNWMEIAGPHIQAAREKNERLEKEYGADVDKLLTEVYYAITGEAPWEEGSDAAPAQ